MTVSCAGWQHRWSKGACRWGFAPIGCMIEGSAADGAVARYQRAVPELFRLDARGLHDGRPTLQLALDKSIKLLRCTTDDVAGLCLRNGRAYRRHPQDVVEDAMDARNQRRIHAGRCGNAVPYGDIETGHGFADRWRVRQLGHRPHRGTGEG